MSETILASAGGRTSELLVVQLLLDGYAQALQHSKRKKVLSTDVLVLLALSGENSLRVLLGRKAYEGLCRWVTRAHCHDTVIMTFWHECHSCSSDRFHVQFFPASCLLLMDLGLT